MRARARTRPPARVARVARGAPGAARAALAALVALLAAPSATGLLYLLRDARLAAGGTRLAGALPLQQLAGDAAQPLARLALAFASAGLAAGLALGLLTRARAARVCAATGVLAWALLVAAGAAADAIASALRFGARVPLQLAHGGLWAEIAALLAGLLLGLRAARPRVRADAGHGPAEHARAAQIVAAHGRDSLDPFALREDKAFHFAAGGLLAYRVIGRTAVVGGDPIGPPGSAPQIVASFAALARERGWTVVATGVSPAALPALRAGGWRALQIGAEALVDPRAFSLEGRPIRKVRQALARVERAGWQIATAPAGALGAHELAQLADVERRWRARQPRLCGYAMTLGRLWGAPEDEDALYVLARDAGGTLRAFLRFARHAHGLSLDAMRRGEVDEPNGLGETMVVAALRHAAQEGLCEVSLNFAGFAHVMAVEADGLRARERMLRWTLGRLHGRFQLERLARFNAKFFPAWRPRYLLYRHRRELPLAALRVLQAEGYVRAPASAPLPARWRPAGWPIGVAADPIRPAPSAAAAPVAPAGARLSAVLGVRAT
jgi:lysylphosphatidylglycerol synthetase-like protein (DUF2156 family)